MKFRHLADKAFPNVSTVFSADVSALGRENKKCSLINHCFEKVKNNEINERIKQLKNEGYHFIEGELLCVLVAILENFLSKNKIIFLFYV
jgi:hypothetical protein